MLLTGFIISIPVFADVALVILALMAVALRAAIDRAVRTWLHWVPGEAAEQSRS